ncbi:MAG: hypothetical protein LKJ17_10570 [Oscillospiraceae bacterium]|nr:hypothetical protein [Oscillospiraceae bacterium]
MTYTIRNPKKNIVILTSICERFPGKITLINEEGYAVNAKSVIGVVYAAAEWPIVLLKTEKRVTDFELTLKQNQLI